MKAVIYAGIGLFSIASVYGLADYYNSQKKGALDKLYTEEEIPAAPKVEEKTTIILPVKNLETGVVENKTVTTKVKSKKIAKKKRREIKFENFSRGRILEEVKIEEVKEEPVKKQDEIIAEKKIMPAKKD
jgi:hypothetical protein